MAMEDTIVRRLNCELPNGRRWEWYPDLNVLALSASVRTCEEREQAISELQDHWRRQWIRVVPDLPA